jgi:histidinol-phosphate/aromatic aminotransferase/cobyric acid decarboxylase-like protein
MTAKTRVIFIANPNNPTGTWVEKDALDTFFKVVPENVLSFSMKPMANMLILQIFQTV